MANFVGQSCRHCEEHKRRSNPFQPYCDIRWIASPSLSSGAHSRDPLARNDGGRLLEVIPGRVEDANPE